MLFTTGLFMVLFCIFLLLYHALKNKPVAKMLLVVAFSLYFYYRQPAPASSSWWV